MEILNDKENLNKQVQSSKMNCFVFFRMFYIIKNSFLNSILYLIILTFIPIYLTLTIKILLSACLMLICFVTKRRANQQGVAIATKLFTLWTD